MKLKHYVVLVYHLFSYSVLVVKTQTKLVIIIIIKNRKKSDTNETSNNQNSNKNKSDNSNETQSSNEQVEHSDKTITVAEAKSIVYNSANSQSFKAFVQNKGELILTKTKVIIMKYLSKHPLEA